jgi:hypothetical protein
MINDHVMINDHRSSSAVRPENAKRDVPFDAEAELVLELELVVELADAFVARLRTGAGTELEVAADDDEIAEDVMAEDVDNDVDGNLDLM